MSHEDAGRAGGADAQTPDIVVEARGVLCPVPIIRLARAAAALPAGTVVELRTDDVAAQHDVPAWCRLRGHRLLHSGALLPDDDRHEGTPSAAGPVPAPVPEPELPEPDVPNPDPAPAQRHLIRLAAGKAAAPGGPS
ncbi:MAG: sulfurtransferase TusA family protein [Candidatus Nanopelagicales bacterium]